MELVPEAPIAETEENVVQKITPATNGRKLDIMVPTHNRLDLTMRCINAIYENTHTPFHLIVVDDSTDLTPLYFERLCKERENISFIHSDTPYKSGNQFFNIALANAQSDYLGIIMNSVRVEPEWEIVALNIMEQNPKVGLIGFKCIFPSNAQIESAGIRMVKWLPSDIGRDWPSHRLSNVYEPDAVQWAFCLLRKSAGIGNLDENTFHGFRGWDDIDNCFVLKKAGWTVLYCGLGVGYHEPRATRGTDTAQAARENRENGMAFYKRWGLWEEFVKEHGEDAPIHRHPGASAQPIEGDKQISNTLLARAVVE